jgi:uncharacterized protein DUF4272
MASTIERRPNGCAANASTIAQIEGIWALTWAIGHIPNLDFAQRCSDDFVLKLPDLKGNKSAATFREAARLRPVVELIGACDLAYCLHWGIDHAQLNRQPVPGKDEPYVIIERRRALEWLFSDEDWDDVPMDT